jgi:hypothetical protein
MAIGRKKKLGLNTLSGTDFNFPSDGILDEGVRSAFLDPMSRVPQQS